jgi:hypothetical protein
MTLRTEELQKHNTSMLMKQKQREAQYKAVVLSQPLSTFSNSAVHISTVQKYINKEPSNNYHKKFFLKIRDTSTNAALEVHTP